MARITFFLGRVHKVGRVTHQTILEAITAPAEIVEREYKYSFIDSHVEMDGKSIKYIYAKMAKFAAQGMVEVVDAEKHLTKETSLKNKKDADVAFVYIPKYEGIAFHRVWNKLKPEQFMVRFDKLISEKLEGIMARAEIEPIANLEKFTKRIGKLKSFTNLEATVTPPNPLFGPAWESLKLHLESRNLKQLQIVEEAKDDSTIKTGLKALLDMVAKKVAPEKIKEAITRASIADQAVLMSVDGYGKAKVRGIDENDKVQNLSTSDDQLSFEFPHMPSKEELYERTYSELQRINSDRQLDH